MRMRDFARALRASGQCPTEAEIAATADEMKLQSK